MKKFEDKEVRWGVLGVGDVCERKSAPAIQKIKDAKLVAVMRRNGGKAQDYAKRHGVPKWYDDADALINDPDINAIYIATPPDAHLALTQKAAAAGKPVYVEKPMARTHDECLQMIAACEQAAVPLFVAYYRRTLPNFLKVKEIIENGGIGEVRYLNITINQPRHPDVKDNMDNNWRINPAISGGGYFYDLGSHQLDFLDFLFGPIAEVKGMAANQSMAYGAEDIVNAVFRFENGVFGSGNWCFTTGESAKKDITTIIGTKGQITYPSFWGTDVMLQQDGKKDQTFEFTMPENIQFFLIQSIVDELLGRGKCPSTGISGARTNWVMDQMIKDYKFKY